MRFIRQIALASVLVVAALGVSYAQTSPQPKPIPKKVKVKPPKQIKSKDIREAQNKLVLTTTEKAVQKANKKINKKIAEEYKAQQKAYAKKLREEERRARKSH